MTQQKHIFNSYFNSCRLFDDTLTNYNKFLSWEFGPMSIWLWKKDQSCPVKLILTYLSELNKLNKLNKTWHTCLWLLKFDLLTLRIFIAFHCSLDCTPMDLTEEKLIVSIPAEYLEMWQKFGISTWPSSTLSSLCLIHSFVLAKNRTVKEGKKKAFWYVFCWLLNSWDL